MTTLANPTIQVNDITIAIKPNSFSYKKGKGDRNVRAQSSGGDAIEMVVTEDAESKFSMAKFTLLTTKENVDSLNSWVDSFDSNTVRASQGAFTLSFRKMVVVAEPEVNTGSEGEFEVEFNGKPIQ